MQYDEFLHLKTDFYFGTFLHKKSLEMSQGIHIFNFYVGRSIFCPIWICIFNGRMHFTACFL